MALLTHIFRKLKIPIAPNKTEGPTTKLVFLGIFLDTLAMEASLPDDKLIRIREVIAYFSAQKTCTKREFLSLLGHLNFASRVIPAGRSFVGHLLERARTVKKLHHRLTLTAGCRRDLAMWTMFLSQWNGVAFFHDQFASVAADLELYTDAASSAGFGGYYAGRWFSGAWPQEIRRLLDTDEGWSMALLELYPIVAAAVLWGGEWNAKRILFHCDNLATVQIIERGRSPVDAIMKLVRRLTWEALTGNFTVRAAHIPGSVNVIADALSRFQMQEFRKLAPEARQDPETCPRFSELVID
jgi:hypothetical protein